MPIQTQNHVLGDVGNFGVDPKVDLVCTNPRREVARGMTSKVDM